MSDEQVQAQPRERGVVRWFNDSKGYGFIGRQDGTDVFVHYSAIQTNGFKSLKEGQEVEFICVKGKKGLQAEDVTKV
jgi:cold shock protein